MYDVVCMYVRMRMYGCVCIVVYEGAQYTLHCAVCSVCMCLCVSVRGIEGVWVHRK